MTCAYAEADQFLPTVSGWLFLFAVPVVTSPVDTGAVPLSWLRVPFGKGKL